jgi:mpaB/rubber oxygenase-like protein
VNLATIENRAWMTTMDPMADEAARIIADDGARAYGEHGRLRALSIAIQKLSDTPPPDPSPKGLAEYVAQVKIPDDLNEERISRAQKRWDSWGVLGVTILGCASLPETYCLPGIARLLMLSGQLEHHVERRLEMTGRMLYDVMKPGGIAAGGPAARTIQRTRLIHAALRYMVLNASTLFDAHHPLVVAQAERKWTDQFGAPINQLELVYTLMTFSHVTIRSAMALGIEPDDGGFEDYLYTWNVVGRMLGIHSELLPDTCDEATRLFETIKAEHADNTGDAEELIRALEAFWCDDWPILSHSLAPKVMFSMFERLLSPETRAILGIRDGDTLAQHEVDFLMKPLPVIVHMTQEVFEALPSTAHLAARIVEHWLNRRSLIVDGGLNDTAKQMFSDWIQIHPRHMSQD